MEWWAILLIGFGLLLAFMASGVPVAFAFAALNIIGLLWLLGPKGLVLFTGSIFESVSAFHFIAVPMFFLMGEILYRGGLIDLVIEVMDKWVGRVRARLLYVSVGSGTVMAALSGAGIADTALLGSTLYPEMERRGYDKKLSYGTLMEAGLLATIIPPSGLAVLVGSLAEVSIGKLLMAGVLPGLLMVFVYVVYINVRVHFNPSLAPVSGNEGVSLLEKLKATVKLSPLAVVIFMVMGFIVLGITTPSEAAATGAIGSVVVLIIYRRFKFSIIAGALRDALRLSGMIFLIISASAGMSQTLALSGATGDFLALLTSYEFSPIIILIAMQLSVFMLGLFMDQVSIMLISIPIFIPVVVLFEFDPIWFWMLFLINMSIGGITPPFGLILFALKSAIPNAKISDLYKAALPYVVLDLMIMGLIIAFPQIATALPNLLFK